MRMYPYENVLCVMVCMCVMCMCVMYCGVYPRIVTTDNVLKYVAMSFNVL